MTEQQAHLHSDGTSLDGLGIPILLHAPLVVLTERATTTNPDGETYTTSSYTSSQLRITQTRFHALLPENINVHPQLSWKVSIGKEDNSANIVTVTQDTYSNQKTSLSIVYAGTKIVVIDGKEGRKIYAQVDHVEQKSEDAVALACMYMTQVNSEIAKLKPHSKDRR